jgi:hypothetical protein
VKNVWKSVKTAKKNMVYGRTYEKIFNFLFSLDVSCKLFSS